MSSEEENIGGAQSFPGGDFADARHALGLSFEQLTRELRLPVRTLESIENGQLEKLGGPVFVRGYIRTYARRLKLDPDRYVALYDRLLGTTDTRSTVRMVGTVSTSPARQSRSLMRFGTFVFLLAIVGTVVWWWQTQYSIDAVIAPEHDAPVTVDTADGNTLVLPPLDDGLPSQEDDLNSALPEVASSAQATEDVESRDMDQEEVAALQEGGATPGAGEDTGVEAAGADGVVSDSETESFAGGLGAEGLSLSLAEDSWLSVKDANGRSLFNGIAKGGQSLDLKGAEPLAVVIGRASAVSRIEYAGEPVDISGVSNKNVARLTLPASQR
ncbi:putative membrane protein [Marinobacterium lacunae]|uniref:Putative membrane protein n=1 Tax=Marinobacterium lacunae TaxID=1232683 RepID=A0A081G267_9GAMM|nr:RodZ family helix-turn-helix domain-containing protein [Marinobacterium lacunae]KEA64872.1 putative membrane protein [Marinobacterium lacunae]